jgi:dCMP deaminase
MSRDNNTQVGALIVAADGTSISWGYNGTISGFNDVLIPHSRDTETLEYTVLDEDILDVNICTFESNKYPFMAHAESNAIFYANGNPKLNGSTLYVTGVPCEKCALEIARAGISRVVVKMNNNDNTSMTNTHSPITKYIFAAKKIQLSIDGISHILDVM